MNYLQTLEYLFNKLPMFTRIGAAAYKPDLTNTITLCKKLNHPEQKFKSIHIAGTNGKGSCSHMLASIFQTAGYKTGLYTSPHLINFSERIKINGEEIEESWIISFVEKLKPFIEEIQPSFFEVTVAMAFEYFAQQKVDIAIIEVGLGGLLDSTNIITPSLSIITNISYDHAYLLGNTIEDIAMQKAGIIKPNIPIVIGETQKETANIFTSIANNNNSTILFADNEYEQIVSKNDGLNLFAKFKKKSSQELIQFHLDLIGNYQLKNSKTVLTAIDILIQKGWRISLTDVLNGIENTKKNTRLKGRFETLQHKPLVIADVAHNEAGLKEVLQQIHQLDYKILHIIIGFVKDKEIEKVLTLFPKNVQYYFTQANIPRALPYAELQKKASAIGLIGQSFTTTKKAIETALLEAKIDDIILVTGSFFILADVYSFIENKNSR